MLDGPFNRPIDPKTRFHAVTLGECLPRLPIPGYDPPRGKARYTVWSDSTSREVRFVPVSKKNARVWYQKARSWDRRSKAKGKHGGGIGLPAMAVLHAFH